MHEAQKLERIDIDTERMKFQIYLIYTGLTLKCERTYLLSEKVLENLEYCRISYFVGHVEQCDGCGHIRVSYNSCRNRHCPKCQGLKKEQWIMSMEENLLPVKYFHLVFTLPHDKYFAYMGTKFKFPPPLALHCSWWRLRRRRKLEKFTF